MSRATITIDGYLSKDPEMRRTQSGDAVLALSVPHQRSKRNQDGTWENQGETTWWQVTLWKEQAEQYASLLKKGAHVLVTGTPEVTTFQKNDGTSGISAQVLFATVGVMPRAPQRQQQQAPADAWGQQPQGGGQPAQQQQGQPWTPQGGQAPQNDVWSAPGGTYDDETPF
jgi:single-strand DNA-binding protein